jgi:hypothetical protein
MGAARRLGMFEAGHAIESSAMAGKCVSTLCRIDSEHQRNASIAIVWRPVSAGADAGFDILFLKNRLSGRISVRLARPRHGRRVGH